MRDFSGFEEAVRGGRNGALLWLALVTAVVGTIGCSGFVQGTSSGGGGGTPLSISNVATSNITDTTVVIGWQTNLSANSQVEYGTTTSYGSTTVLDQAAVTNHSETVSGLKPTTLYHFRVHSGTAVSGDSTFTTSPDKTPPSVSITSPAANATLSGTVTLTATASDDVAVASVQFRVDSGNIGAPITTAPYSYSLNTTTLADGTHVLTAVATDTSGNTATSSGVTVAVNNASPAPSISSLNPTSGLVGTSVTITGANFGSSQGTSTVKFNGTAATPTSWSATSIVAPVPAGATTGNVVVTVGGVASNGASFTVTVPAPSISSLNPTSGLVGTSVTITGANFGSSQGSSTVKFNGTAATPTSWSATSIVAPVPSGATTGNVVVTVGSVASNGVIFTVNVAATPSISNLNPTNGLVGTSVTITGANFGATQGTSTVTFNGVAAIPTSWSATSIVAPVPAGATTGNVVVTVGGVASNGASFTVTVPAPSISSLNPTSGAVGTSVTITGANFGSSQGTSTVKFNGTAATPTSWSATSIVAPVPAGATTGNVVVTVGGTASNGASFTVTVPAPSISSLNPSSGPVGTSVTISGTNFGATQGSSTVAFNGTTATPTSWSTTSIVAPVPAGASTGNVVVTVGGTPSNGLNFTVSSSGSATPALVDNAACPNSAGLSGQPWGGTPPYDYRCPTPELTTAGNTLLVAFGFDASGGNQTFAVTDEQGDPFTLDVSSPLNNNRELRIYRATNIAANSAWINVSLTSGQLNGYWQPMVFEVDNAATLDGASCNSGTSNSITAGPMTPTAVGDLILQVSYAPTYASNTSFSAGSQSNISWALAHTLLGDGSASQWGIYNSASPINPTFTAGTSNPFLSCAVALQASSTGGAPTAFHVYHQEHDAMPHNASNPWKVGVYVDIPGAVYLAYVGNDSITSVTSSPAPNVGWTASGADFNGLNGHNHVNFYCASWTTPPGYVTVDINRSGTSNDSINMMYVVAKGTCNLDADSGGQAGNQGSQVSQLTICSGCLTPTTQNDIIFQDGGQYACTGTSLAAPTSGALFEAGWFDAVTIDGPTQTDENNFWSVIRNGTSLSPITVTVNESCDAAQQYWASRVAAYKTLP
jgi:hypothetical protein